MMSSVDPNITIDELAKIDSGKLYIKYILYRGEEGYYYRIDTDYSDNVIQSINLPSYLVNLREISVS